MFTSPQGMACAISPLWEKIHGSRGQTAMPKPRSFYDEQVRPGYIVAG